MSGYKKPMNCQLRMMNWDIVSCEASIRAIALIFRKIILEIFALEGLGRLPLSTWVGMSEKSQFDDESRG